MSNRDRAWTAEQKKSAEAQAVIEAYLDWDEAREGVCTNLECFKAGVAYAATLRQQGEQADGVVSSQGDRNVIDCPKCGTCVAIPKKLPTMGAPGGQGGRVEGELVLEGLDYFDKAGDAGDKKYVKAIRTYINSLHAALAQNAQGEAKPFAYAMTCFGRPTEFYEKPPAFVPPISKLTPVYLHAERARVPGEASQALEFYANGGHDVALHIRDRKKGEPDSYAWWSMKRKQLEAKGYSLYGEDADGTEHYAEDGSVARAALAALAAAPSQPEAADHD